MQHRTCAGLQNGANQPQHVGMVPGECNCAVLAIVFAHTRRLRRLHVAEDRRVKEVRLDQIRRPLRRTRANGAHLLLHA